MAFQIGQTVSLIKNKTIKDTQAKIVFDNIQSNNTRLIIVESSVGWHPNEKFIELYNLDPSKKYLFAKESELS